MALGGAVYSCANRKKYLAWGMYDSLSLPLTLDICRSVGGPCYDFRPCRGGAVRSDDPASAFVFIHGKKKGKRKESQEVLALELAPVSTARLAAVICKEITNLQSCKKG